jgi:DnaK suppressor protein
MNKRDLKIFKSMLDSSKKRILEKKESKLVGTYTKSDDLLNLSLTFSELYSLKEIEQSLKMIEEKNYGICIDCNNSIPISWLYEQPCSKRCVKCQLLYDKNRVLKKSKLIIKHHKKRFYFHDLNNTSMPIERGRL